MEKETNLEYYLPELKMLVKEAYGSPKLIFTRIKLHMDPEIKSTQDTYTGDILDWMAQPHEMSILDSKEKKYLSEVIRPFRKEVTGIVKQKDMIYCQDFITILVGEDYSSLPRFERDTMYKGMEYDKTYKPEELGL